MSEQDTSQNLFLNFMQEYWTPEETAMYSEIMDLIAGVHDDYPDNIDLVIYSLNDDYTINDVSDILRMNVQEMLKSMLMNVGVFLREDFNLDNYTLYLIYKEMITIEANEQVDTILGMLEDDREESIVFYEILSQVGGLTVDENDYHRHVYKISPFTRSKLRAYLLNKQFEGKQAETKDVHAAVKRLKRFIEKAGSDDYLVVKLIRKGVRMGLPLRAYLDLYKDEWMNLEFNEMCYNLYLFALISDKGWENIMVAIEEHIPNYFHEVVELDAINQGIRKLQLAYTDSMV